MIVFNGNKYKTREVDIKGWGTRLIAGETLERQLVQNDEYVSETAKFIEQSIFFFVDDSYLDAEDEILAAKVEKEFV